MCVVTKRVLLVCPSFPPVNDTSCRRAAAFSKYLARMSWHVSVLAAQHPGTPSYLLTPQEAWKLAGVHEDRITRVDAKSFAPKSRLSVVTTLLKDHWVLPGSGPVSWCQRVFRTVPVYDYDLDAIWATYPGAGPLLVASKLSKILDLPWIADFRDLPNQNAKVPKWIRLMAMIRIRQISSSASHWVTVSEPMGKALKTNYRDRVVIIPNGYDLELLPASPFKPAKDAFTIVYTGVVANNRDPNPLIRAVNALISEGFVTERGIQIFLYGSSKDRINGDCLPFLGKTVHVEPYVSLTDVMRIQMQATVLLVLGIPRMHGLPTGKLFEYMIAGRPVIAYPKDVTGIDAVLQKTGIGKSCDSEAELKELILDWYRQWATTGDIKLPRNPVEIEKYSRQRHTRQLASLLREAIALHRRRKA